MNPVIPPKSNRKEKRDYDRAPSCGIWWRTVSEFKQRRGVATRYAKNSLSYRLARFGPWRFGLNYFDDTP